jgi:hypothetical protein
MRKKRKGENDICTVFFFFTPVAINRELVIIYYPRTTMTTYTRVRESGIGNGCVVRAG